MSVQGQLPLALMIYYGELSPQHCPLGFPWHGEILLRTPKSTSVTRFLLRGRKPEEDIRPQTICMASGAQRCPHPSLNRPSPLTSGSPGECQCPTLPIPAARDTAQEQRVASFPVITASRKCWHRSQSLILKPGPETVLPELRRRKKRARGQTEQTAAVVPKAANPWTQWRALLYPPSGALPRTHKSVRCFTPTRATISTVSRLECSLA